MRSAVAVRLAATATAVVAAVVMGLVFVEAWCGRAAAAYASNPAQTRESARADQVTYSFTAAIRHLEVARHSHESSYDRDAKFGGWVGQGDGCDTRAVVLQDESKVPVTQNSNCTIQTGRWRSYYNATTYTHADELQIDHVVPVKNVWISGGWRWTSATRVAYYNDLDDPRTLVAVDSHDNESKSDQTPDQWLPPSNQCRYVREFVAIKLRWSLTVSRAEKKSIRAVANTCRNARITYEPAAVTSRSGR